MTFLLYTSVLLALLMLAASGKVHGEVLGILRRLLDELRRGCGLGHLWRRNMNALKRDKAIKEREKLRRGLAENL